MARDLAEVPGAERGHPPREKSGAPGVSRSDRLSGQGPQLIEQVGVAEDEGGLRVGEDLLQQFFVLYGSRAAPPGQPAQSGPAGVPGPLRQFWKIAKSSLSTSPSGSSRASAQSGLVCGTDLPL